jgi:hypothetical protein
VKGFQSELVQDEQSSIPPTPADPVSVAHSKSRNKTVFIMGAVVAGLFLCVVLCAVVIGTGTIKAALAREDVEQVVEEFMHAMAGKDTEAAYALFSTRAKRTASRSDLEDLLQDNNFLLFDGYTSAQVTDINLGTTVQTNPDLPQGIVAKVNGTIAYKGGFTGRFDAVLEQESKEWKLFGINITIPPEKLGK